MPQMENRYKRKGSGKMVCPDMPTACERLTPHTNGTNGKVSTPDLYWKDILYFQYDNNEDKLEAWLFKIIPVAQLSAYRYETTVFIENGASVADTIDKILEECKVKVRRTVGFYGHYQVTMSSGPHEECTKYLSFPNRNLRKILIPFLRMNGMLPEAGQDLEDILTQIEGVEDFLDELVSMTGPASTIQEDGIAERLVEPVNDYCRESLDSKSRVHPSLADARSSPMYEKAPDMSYHPAYYSMTAQETATVESVSAICEVAMSDSLSKGVFDVLTSFAGTRFLLDLGLVVNIEPSEDTDSIDHIRLILFDGTVEKLVAICEDNRSRATRAVAFVTREKIDNKLKNLRILQGYVNSEEALVFPDDGRRQDMLEVYRQFTDSIEYTISQLQNSRNIVEEVIHQPTNGEENRNQDDDIVQTCRALLNNSTVVELRRDNGVIMSSANELRFPAVSYLGLLLGRDIGTHVTLTANKMRKIYLAVENAFQLKNLEKFQPPVRITVSLGCINPEHYDAFVQMQGEEFDVNDFINGGSYTTRRLEMGFFTLDVLTHFAVEYDPGLGGKSKRIMMAAALQLLSTTSDVEGNGERERRDCIYNLVRKIWPELMLLELLGEPSREAPGEPSGEPLGEPSGGPNEPLEEQGAQNANANSRLAGPYGRFIRDLLKDHADASKRSRDWIRDILNNEGIKNLVEMGNNESHLREMINGRTLDGLLHELGEDITKARNTLITNLNPGSRRR